MINLYKYNKIVENFFSLIVLNIVNYVFPIIIIPVLIQRLGVDVYGKYIFAFTILNYLNLIVQYGFNFSATNKVAKSQNNRLILFETYSSVTIIRVIFSIIISVGIIIFGFFFKDQMNIYLMGIGIFFGQGLIPVWLFQGLEKMRFITIINTIVRVLAFVSIILLIKEPGDVNKLMLIQTFSYLVGGIASLLLVRSQLKIELIVPRLNIIKENLQEGWSLFLSTVGMNLYRESNVVILGMVAGYTTVGLYSPAEKLIKGVQSFTNIIVTALYPHFSKKMSNDKSSGTASFIKFGKLLSILFVTVTVLIFLLSDFIIDLYIGKGNYSTITDFRILSLVILFGGLNYYYGIVGLVNFKKQKLFNRLVWISGLVGVSASLFLSILWTDAGAAIAMVIAELILLLLILKSLKEAK